MVGGPANLRPGARPGPLAGPGPEACYCSRMRWAAWIAAAALLATACVGQDERLAGSGWRGEAPEDAAGVRDAGSARDAASARDAGPARDARAPVDGGRSRTDASRPGGQCRQASDCLSGFCVDGVCCNEACTGPCVSCALTGRVGTCWPVDTGAPDPRGLCVDQGPVSCGSDGTCDGVGACARYPAGTACAASSCTGILWSSARTCDGLGTCGAGTAVSCVPYGCDSGGGRCNAGCATSDDCAPGVTCNKGVCGTFPPATCATDDECASGHCAQGVCCASACAAPCASCALPGTVGTCEPDPNADPSTCG